MCYIYVGVKAPHVPFRNSKLTRILAEALGLRCNVALEVVVVVVVVVVAVVVVTNSDFSSGMHIYIANIILT